MGEAVINLNIARKAHFILRVNNVDEFVQRGCNRQVRLDVGVNVTQVADQLMGIATVTLVSPVFVGTPPATAATLLAEQIAANRAFMAGCGGSRLARGTPDNRRIPGLLLAAGFQIPFPIVLGKAVDHGVGGQI